MEIWYLLKYPEAKEKDCVNRNFKDIYVEELGEILCFQYQRMIRYGGKWHLEKRLALPGYIFVDGSDEMIKNGWYRKKIGECDIFLIPCEIPYLKGMCYKGSLIELSRGIIKYGDVVITDGPLKGREALIQRIDRHKRTAEIEIPFAGGQKQITVGLEIYEKEA